MKKNFIRLLVASLAFIHFSCENEEPIKAVVERGLDRATSQSLILAKDILDEEGKLPRTFEGGEVKTTSFKAWVSGFFPGTLWYLYENNPTEELKMLARAYTVRVEEAKHVTSHHDVGFMLYCSYGNGYRLTNDSSYLDVMKTGAESLATRYNPTVGLIKSWETRDKWQYPVIIDNMMNLEFLLFASQVTGDKRYLNMANAHAAKTMKHHFRPDYSSYHVVSYDTITGLPHAKNTHQGYADESAWARGQAWGVYSYTMMYRETGK